VLKTDVLWGELLRVDVIYEIGGSGWAIEAIECCCGATPEELNDTRKKG